MAENTTIQFDLARATTALLYKRAQKVLMDMMNDMGIEKRFYDINTLISYTRIRNIIIRQEYDEMVNEGIKHMAIEAMLAEKYKIAQITIRNIVSIK